MDHVDPTEFLHERLQVNGAGFEILAIRGHQQHAFSVAGIDHARGLCCGSGQWLFAEHMLLGGSGSDREAFVLARGRRDVYSGNLRISKTGVEFGRAVSIAGLVPGFQPCGFPGVAAHQGNQPGLLAMSKCRQYRISGDEAQSHDGVPNLPCPWHESRSLRHASHGSAPHRMALSSPGRPGPVSDFESPGGPSRAVPPNSRESCGWHRPWRRRLPYGPENSGVGTRSLPDTRLFLLPDKKTGCASPAVFLAPSSTPGNRQNPREKASFCTPVRRTGRRTVRLPVARRPQKMREGCPWLYWQNT